MQQGLCPIISGCPWAGTGWFVAGHQLYPEGGLQSDSRIASLPKYHGRAQVEGDQARDCLLNVYDGLCLLQNGGHSALLNTWEALSHSVGLTTNWIRLDRTVQGRGINQTTVPWTYSSGKNSFKEVRELVQGQMVCIWVWSPCSFHSSCFSSA